MPLPPATPSPPMCENIPLFFTFRGMVVKEQHIKGDVVENTWWSWAEYQTAAMDEFKKMERHFAWTKLKRQTLIERISKTAVPGR